MIYYKVPKDGQVYNAKTCKYTPIVENELLTAKECERIGLNYKKLLPVEVSRKKTYFFFGARFECNY